MALFAGVVTKAQTCLLSLLESRLDRKGVLEESSVPLQKVSPSGHLHFGSLLSLWDFTYGKFQVCILGISQGDLECSA